MMLHDAARCCATQTSRPETMTTFMHLRNRTPTRANKGVTPYERIKPEVGNIRTVRSEDGSGPGLAYDRTCGSLTMTSGGKEETGLELGERRGDERTTNTLVDPQTGELANCYTDLNTKCKYE